MRTEPSQVFDRRQWDPDHAADALRAHGCRVTQPRVAVLRVLLERGGTISATELSELAQIHQPGIHEATVYRTVKVLTEVGIVSHIHAGHGPSLVRLAGDSQPVAVCRECGRISPVPDRAVADFVEVVAAQTGFVVELGHFALEGVCADCTA